MWQSQIWHTTFPTGMTDLGISTILHILVVQASVICMWVIRRKNENDGLRVDVGAH